MTFTLALKQKAVDFNLPGTDGRHYTLKDFTNPFLVVFFTCNHCPYVVNSDEYTRATAEAYPQAQFVAINSNSEQVHAIDGFTHMGRTLNLLVENTTECFLKL